MNKHQHSTNLTKEPTNDLPDAIASNEFVKDLRKKKISYRLLGLLLFLCLITGGSWFIYRRAFLVFQQQATKHVMTVAVERLNVAIKIEANGTIQPEKQINISPKSVGVLKSLLVKEGEVVKQGQILAYMDDRNLQGQLTEAKGELASAQANLQRLLNGNRSEDIAEAEAHLKDTEASLREAELTFAQNQTLYEAGAISQRDFENSRASRDSSQARVIQAQQALVRQQRGARPEEISQARAQVLAAKGRLQTIQTQLQDLVIRAPFNGVVSRKYADPGAFVSPTTAGSSVTSATSSSILSLATTNQIVANVAESHIAQIRLGQQVTFEADAYRGKTFTGRVTQIAVESTVEQNVTSFEVKVAILNDSEQLLLSGMNVNVEFQAGELKKAIVVPTAAIVRQPNTTGVFVAGKNNQPIFTPITTGVTVQDKTVIQSGLTGKEKLFISPPSSKSRSILPDFFKGSFSPKRR